MNLVFVGGVHGVGKSTACEHVATALDCLHASASGLIRQERADAVAKQGKLVADISGNQELLLCGLRRLRNSTSSQCILLDGHFALRESSGDIQRLPMTVFRNLAPNHLVCFKDDPAAIALRMSQRDADKVDVRQVSLLQDQELSYAGEVALDLQIPFTVLRAFDFDGLQRLAAVVARN